MRLRLTRVAAALARAAAALARVAGEPAAVVAHLVRHPHQLRFAFMVALSHMRGRRREMALDVLTTISIAGVAVGVTALVMVLSVMEGFEIDLRDKILGSNAHVVVLSYSGSVPAYVELADRVEGIEGVRAAAPFVYGEAMMRSDFASTGVVIKGIDPGRTPRVTDVDDALVYGPDGPLSGAEARLEVLGRLAAPIADPKGGGEALPGIIVGQELAEQLQVFVGDRVYVINPAGAGVGPLGVPMPRVLAFRVAGIFDTGMYEYDTKWTYVSIPDAQRFLQLGDVATGLEIAVDDIDAADEVAARIDAALGFPYYARHWKALNRPLFSALKLEKIVMGLILSLIIMVASLNIVGSLVVVVVTRAREISILRAMGAAARTVQLVFMLEGLVVGVVGASIGTVLGLAGCWALDRYQYPLDTDVYYLDTLPVVVEPATVATVAISAVLIAFLATLRPAAIAARLDPVEGLRYE